MKVLVDRMTIRLPSSLAGEASTIGRRVAESLRSMVDVVPGHIEHIRVTLPLDAHGADDLVTRIARGIANEIERTRS